ncbi:MAG: GHKL domain-containing protein [Nitrospinae bacterium]|nr:GHKL domain-containing protein [Nitrospinota bacterium]
MSKNTFRLTAIALAGSILFIDVLTPLGVADAILYVALVMFCFWASDLRAPFIMAVTASVLTLLGAALSPSGEAHWGVVAANRVLSMIAIWISAIIVWKFKVGEISLQKAHDELESKVAERTRQLSKARDELEKRVADRTSDLTALNEELKTFAYIVSHDLRAPLINIRGFTGELKMGIGVIGRVLEKNPDLLETEEGKEVAGLLKEDVPEALKFIDSSAVAMDSMINAILKLSRLEQKNFKREKMNTLSVVESVLESLSYQIEANGTQIRVGNLPDVEADDVSMEQVFANTISNAVKYLDPSRPGKIEISGQERENDTLFMIKDNGRGIAKEDFGKVFQIFRRAGKQDVAGEGMGLAYVQTIIRRHGGQIWLESEPDVGTTFFIAIPKTGAA